MAFHFTLSALLRLRESLERFELQRLQSLAAQLAQVRAEIDLVDGEIETARREIVEQAAAGIFGSELHAALASETARGERRAALLAKQHELEQAHRSQVARFKDARQRREILSNLRDRQFSEYQREEARREQQRVDELFLIRRAARERME